MPTPPPEPAPSPTRRFRWGLLARVAFWAITVLGAVDAFTQVVGVTWLAPIYILQALTPYLLVVSALLAAAQLVRRRMRTAALLGLIVLSLGWWTVALIVPTGRGTRPDVFATATIVSANTYYGNDQADRAAAALLSAAVDVIAIPEYSPQLADALTRQGADTAYPYRTVQSSSARDGIALLSRYPLTSSSIEPVGNEDAIIATVDIGGTALRLLVVHPLPGVKQGDFESWSHDLGAIGAAATVDGPPIVIVGDFNATQWHPAFRDLLDRGFVDAHAVLNQGWSRSWPVGMFGVPPFAQLDHALLGSGVYVESLHELVVPGSDHHGFVVTVAVDSAR